MLFSDALEIAIGLSFIFLLMSLIMTAAKEGIESFSKSRGKRLFQGFLELLHDPALPGAAQDAAKSLYSHSLIQSLYRGNFTTAQAGSQLPSYVPSRSFALALIDQVMAGNVNAAETDASLPTRASQVEQLRLAAERIENAQVRNAVLHAIGQAGGNLEKVQNELATWFDTSMDRVSGWYKRRSQGIIFWLGLFVAVLLNVNAITIAESLSKNATLRRAIVEQAGHFQQIAPASDQAALPASGGRESNAATNAMESGNSAVGRADGTGIAGPLARVDGTRNVASNAVGSGNSAVERTDRSVNAAGAGGASGARSNPAQSLDQLDEIERVGLPIGWGEGARTALLKPLPASDRGSWDWWLPAIFGSIQITLGFLMTALAITLGAPFWFDLLNRLMVVRETVKPHEKSREEASQDPQDRPGANAGTSVVVVNQQPAPPPEAGPPPEIDTDIFSDSASLGPDERPREEDPDDESGHAAAPVQGEG